MEANRLQYCTTKLAYLLSEYVDQLLFFKIVINTNIGPASMVFRPSHKVSYCSLCV